MIRSLRRFRALALLLLPLTPGGVGSQLMLHACPPPSVQAPTAAAVAEAGTDHDAHAAHLAHAGHVAPAESGAPAAPEQAHRHGGPLDCHCVATCSMGTATAASVVAAVLLGVPAEAAHAAPPADAAALPVARPLDRLPPSTAPPLA
ncbi:MAG: hypothetical protein NW201_05040 [Gemmatimonadales bacterium]|nr:hypothetical protein [Gemmatimonadales bacterium]